MLVSALGLALLTEPAPPSHVPPPAPTHQAVVPVISAGVVSFDPRILGRPLPEPEPQLKVPPVRVVIPSIGVDSPLVHLGLNPDHTLEVPEDYRVAGWYKHSAIPGNPGPAIIAGHVDSFLGPGVFFSLALLKPGQEVVVKGPGGETRFVVERVGRFPKSAFPTDLVYGPLPYPGLRLITCGGAFNRDTRHYLDNVVVFARAHR